MTSAASAPTPLDDEALEDLGRLGEKMEFAEGETFIRLGPGETFGEHAIFRSAPTAADVVAVTAVTMLRFPGECPPALSPSVGPFGGRCSAGWPT